MDDRATNAIECTRWWLDDSATDNRGHAVPRWLIVSSYGVGHWSSQHQDLLLAVAIWRLDFYTLPTSPERLGGSLQLLCCSSIVTTLENEVEHPELLSLRQIYDEFDSWGHMYKLGRVNVNGRPTPAVDVVAAFDEADEGFERYPDDPEDRR